MLRPTERSNISALAIINMTEPGSPPLSGPDAGSFCVVPEEHEQLIRKTWETTKRDETDWLGLDVQPQVCIQLEINPEKPISRTRTNSII